MWYAPNPMMLEPHIAGSLPVAFFMIATSVMQSLRRLGSSIDLT
jgi:hypothetical protein